VTLDAAVLYADIDGSTNMVDSQTGQFSAEIYKSYLLCAARLIRLEGGVITAYDGDRVMAVFIGNSKNTSAVRCGLKIRCAVENIVNPAIKAQYSTDFQLRQIVGIDTSTLLVARTGIRGSNDLVWVGPAANHAAKLSSISEQPFSTFISAKAYEAMNKEVKLSSDGRNMWSNALGKEKRSTDPPGTGMCLINRVGECRRSASQSGVLAQRVESLELWKFTSYARPTALNGIARAG
jgi:class 3 adenylate cyclase